MQTIINDFPIANIVFRKDFKNLFEKQPIYLNELTENIKINGLLTNAVIDENNVLVDGFLLVIAHLHLRIKTIKVVKLNKVCTIEDRINYNLQRIKTDKDILNEFLIKIEKIKKIQGRKENGESSTYAEKISACLNNRWIDPETINRIVHVSDNDLPGHILTLRILKGTDTPNSAYTFVTETMKIDKEKNFSLTNKVANGMISAKDANKILKNLKTFENDTIGTLRIPEKCISINDSCTTIEKLAEYHKQVDLILTSPPYFDQKQYGGQSKDQTGKESSEQEYIKKLVEMVLCWVCTLKESGSLMINIAETYRDGVGLGIPFKLIAEIEKTTGLKYYDTIIWSKKNSRSNGSTEDIRPRNVIEYVLWFVVNPKKVKYKKLTYKFPDTKPSVLRKMDGYDRNGKDVNNKIKALSGYKSICNHIDEQQFENIIRTSTGTNHLMFKLPKNEHPAVMSALLPICPILMTTDENDLVFDPFSGTNVVGYISQLLNRRTLTTELSSQYFMEGCSNLQKGIDEFNRQALDIVNNKAYDSDSNINQAA